MRYGDRAREREGRDHASHECSHEHGFGVCQLLSPSRVSFFPAEFSNLLVVLAGHY